MDEGRRRGRVRSVVVRGDVAGERAPLAAALALLALLAACSRSTLNVDHALIEQVAVVRSGHGGRRRIDVGHGARANRCRRRAYALPLVRAARHRRRAHARDRGGQARCSRARMEARGAWAARRRAAVRGGARGARAPFAGRLPRRADRHRGRRARTRLHRLQARRRRADRRRRQGRCRQAVAPVSGREQRPRLRRRQSVHARRVQRRWLHARAAAGRRRLRHVRLPGCTCLQRRQLCGSRILSLHSDGMACDGGDPCTEDGACRHGVCYASLEPRQPRVLSSLRTYGEAVYDAATDGDVFVFADPAHDRVDVAQLQAGELEYRSSLSLDGALYVLARGGRRFLVRGTGDKVAALDASDPLPSCAHAAAARRAQAGAVARGHDAEERVLRSQVGGGRRRAVDLDGQHLRHRRDRRF